MHGTFQMITEEGEPFDAVISLFTLAVPVVLSIDVMEELTDEQRGELWSDPKRLWQSYENLRIRLVRGHNQ